ncbi:MAG: hypothetical protein ACP5OA_00010 [Candidatus Woesearchaeota archaeon]
MERLTKIGDGNDSTVYLPEHEQYVIKVYDGMIGEMDSNTRLSFLNWYVTDTLRASEIINKNGFNRVFYFGHKTYDIIPSIVPQGEIVEIIPENTNILPMLGKKQYHALIGQRYVKGENLSYIIDTYNKNTGDSIFHKSINTFESGIKRSLNDVQEELQKKMGMQLLIGRVNVKPILDEEQRLLKLEITDLANSLLDVYKNRCQ